jgi:signal peptidase I
VSDLVVKRDIYYTLTPGRIDYGNAWDSRLPRTPTDLADMLADPIRVAALGQLPWKDYPMGKDRFLMLGDNSPRSKDGRGWDTTDRYVAGDPESGLPDRGWDASGRESWEVPRNMLTGKAFCTYIIPEVLGWPKGKPLGLNFKRVKWIH